MNKPKHIFPALFNLFLVVFVLFTYESSAQTTYCDSITLNANIPDTVFLCGEDSAIISADPGFASYEWSRGDTTNELTMYYSGKYYLTVSDDSACVSVDSTVVSIINASIIQTDTLLCFGESLTINTEQNSSNFTSIDFDGLSSYVAFSDTGLPQGNQQRSFEAWIYNSGQTAMSCIFCYGDDNTDEAFAIFLDQNDSLKLKINSDFYVCNQTIPQNTWTHISVGTDQSFKYSFTINGILINSNLIQGIYNTSLSSFAYLGRYLSVPANSFFNGMMDEVRIWNRFVSGNEYDTKRHLNNLTDVDLLRFWDFNYFTANQSNDVYGFHADLYNITVSNLIPFSSYIFNMTWSTGGFGDSLFILPSQGQYYYLYISDDVSECIDSVHVQLAVPPNMDDSLFVCNESAVILDAGAGYDSYIWNTGDLQEQISVTTGGMYSVETTQENCYFQDSTFLSLINIEILQSDTSICPGETIVLNATSSAGNFYWSNDAISSSITVHPLSTSFYQVSSSDGYNTCYAGINVTVFPEIVLTLDDSVIACNQSSAGLFIANPNFETYSWSTGDTTLLTFASTPGYYFVTVVDQNSCSATDSVFVDFMQVGILQNDTTVCGSSSLNLDASGTPSNYIWSDGQTGSSIIVSPATPTTYYVSVSNGSFTCSDNVNVSLTPAINVSLSDSLLSCEDTIFSLSPGSGPYDYLWNTGSTFESMQVSQSGVYTVTVTDAYNCQEVVSSLVSIIDAYLTISDTLVCPGEEVIVSSNSSAYTYLWSNGSTDAILFDYPDESVNYHLYVSNDYATCHYVTSLDVYVIETGEITGPTEVWQDTTVTYSIVPNYSSSYEWFVSGGIYTNNIGPEIEVTWNNIVTGYVSVTETTVEGCVGEPVEISVNVLPHIGINSISGIDNIEIIPNPLEDISFILIPESYRNGIVFIYDISGKLVKEFTLKGDREISLSKTDFAAGVYTVLITAEDRIKTKLLVK